MFRWPKQRSKLTIPDHGTTPLTPGDKLKVQRDVPPLNLAAIVRFS
jgi:hypothetical protein